MEHNGEDLAYLREQVITCIGNKRALLPFIAAAVDRVRERLGKKRLRILDLFSGSGIVARFFKQYSEFLLANDLELYSFMVNSCYLSNVETVPTKRLGQALKYLRATLERPRPGFFHELYAPEDDRNIRPGERVFYTKENALILDTARAALDDVDKDLRVFLLAPLLAEASIHANTSGVFKGFYKGRDGIGRFGGHGGHALSRITGRIELRLPIFSRFSCEHRVARSDAGPLTASLSGSDDFDLAYLDPPYNQHPYGSNYFMLNLLAENRRPERISQVSGIPVDWNRSPYNKKSVARESLFSLISALPARFILISYNSEGFIPHEDFLGFLRAMGRLELIQTPYNTFRAGRNLAERPIHVVEFLYLLEKNDAAG